MIQINEVTLQQCVECRGKVVLTHGTYVCEECGLVIEPQYVSQDYIITKQPDSPEMSKQYVSPGERVDMVDGLGSYIGNFKKNKTKDAYGNPLSKEKQLFFKRLNRIYNFRARIRHKESQYRVLKSLNRVVVRLQISDETKQRAAYIYRKALKEDGSKNELTHPVLMTAALFLSIRESKEPVTLQELADAVRQLGHRITPKSIIRGTEFLKKLPGIELIRRQSEAYIPRLISKLLRHPDIKVRLQRRLWTPSKYHLLLKKAAYTLLGEITTKERGGRHPYIFAAAVIYSADKIIAKQMKKRRVLTQKLLAKIANVAEYSIRDHYCALLKKFVKADQNLKVPL